MKLSFLSAQPCLMRAPRPRQLCGLWGKKGATTRARGRPVRTKGSVGLSRPSWNRSTIPRYKRGLSTGRDGDGCQLQSEGTRWPVLGYSIQPPDHDYECSQRSRVGPLPGPDDACGDVLSHRLWSPKPPLELPPLRGAAAYAPGQAKCGGRDAKHALRLRVWCASDGQRLLASSRSEEH